MPYLRNKRTGQVIEVDASGRPMGQAGPPPDPTFPLQGPKMQGDIAHTSAETTATTAQGDKTRAEIPFIAPKAIADVNKAKADALAAQANAAKVARELADQQHAAQIKQASEGMSNDEVLSSIGRARDLTGYNTTGLIGDWLKSVGGTDARDLAAKINTIAAGTTLSKLQQLKEQSSTGASGLGQLSNREGDLLRDSVSSLDQGQSPGEFTKSLGAVEQHYRRLRAVQSGADPRSLVTQNQFGIRSGLQPDGAMAALQQGYQSLTQRMQGKTPPQRAAMLRAFNANPEIVAIKAKAGFRDPGPRTQSGPTGKPTVSNW